MMRRPHLPLLVLLSAALFLRALVPAGWMPAPSQGVFAIEPCPAADDVFVGHSATHHGHHKAEHGGDCAFAPLQAGFASLDLAPALLAVAPTRFAPPAQPLTAAFPTGPPAPPPPATGPPTIA